MQRDALRRVHRMPFGAQCEAGGVRFRLWAPAAQAVDLLLGSADAPHAHRMTAAGEGWHTLWVPKAGGGTRYAFKVDAGPPVADPASRCNPDGVHGASAVVDPASFVWNDSDWRGLPWSQAVLYELHIGTFTPQGTFAAVVERLDHLVRTDITAIELMPVAAFPGCRNWGYDGVLPFAPATSYGTPDDLKRLVEAAHARGLAVLLDVVYNHFGPDGNHLARYAPPFFRASRHTPWGSAIDFDGPQSRTVRDFFIHNALYWIEEFHIDGLRLDAVDAIHDASRPDIVEEIAHRIQAGPGRERHVHLLLESRRTERRHLARTRGGCPRCATAQWNDDLHHAAHVLGTGETAGYYARHAAEPLVHFARALAGDSLRERGGATHRVPPRASLPPTAFVAYLQNHDQIGNRPHGERLTRLMSRHCLRVLTACVLLAPSAPMLFMGEEWAATTPFLFFCDFDAALARAVDAGRRRGFARLAPMVDAVTLTSLAYPNDPATFHSCKLDWSEPGQPHHAQWHNEVRALLAVRRAQIAPHLARMPGAGRFELRGPHLLQVDWPLGKTRRLRLLAHLPCETDIAPVAFDNVQGKVIHAVAADPRQPAANWSACWTIVTAEQERKES
jgi:malto-oligosyltrehalose trehalohydrolase